MLGGSYVGNDHHVIGLSAGVVPDFRYYQKCYPMISTGYSYYLRKIGMHHFNASLVTSLDYWRYKNDYWSMLSHQFYWNVGAGISFRYLKNFTTGLDLTYIFLQQYSWINTWSDINGNKHESKYSGKQFGFERPYMPLQVKLRVGYLIR
jgi:hypothetical protein